MDFFWFLKNSNFEIIKKQGNKIDKNSKLRTDTMKVSIFVKTWVSIWRLFGIFGKTETEKMKPFFEQNGNISKTKRKFKLFIGIPALEQDELHTWDINYCHSQIFSDLIIFPFLSTHYF